MASIQESRSESQLAPTCWPSPPSKAAKNQNPSYNSVKTEKVRIKQTSLHTKMIYDTANYGPVYNMKADLPMVNP